MIWLAGVLLLAVVYETGYCIGKKSERRNITKKIELLGGKYVRKTEKTGS